MNEYHKIQTVFLRDPENKYKTLLEDQFALPEFEYLKNNKWVFTEKVDGTNIRLMLDGTGQYRIGGKTNNAQIPSFLYDRLRDLMETRLDKMNQIFDNTDVCLYGEGFGAKIQKGGGNYIKDAVDFVLFDVKVGDWWLKQTDVIDVAIKLDLAIVPIIGNGSLYEMVNMTKEGFSSVWGDFMAEGIVARPVIVLFGRNGKRIITKIKHKDFD